MPRVLQEAEVDSEADALDVALEDEKGRAGMQPFSPLETAPDLTDGGRLGSVRVFPTQDHRKQSKGRPAARPAWMWNGTESLLPLAWNPDGTMHDGARRYLLKKHCLCCRTGGFRGKVCPNCAKSNCDQCGAGTKPKNLIPCFYLRKEDVPFPARFYGSINCFLELCPRREGKGFLTQQDMRVHARNRHKLEYQAYMEAQQAAKSDEIASLREQVNSLIAGRENGQRAEVEREKARERMAKARAARKPKVANKE